MLPVRRVLLPAGGGARFEMTTCELHPAVRREHWEEVWRRVGHLSTKVGCDAHKVRRWPLKSESWGLERSWQVIRADHEPRGGRRRAELRRARVLGGEADQLSP